MRPEAAGANCANGGQRIDTGADGNGNKLLDPSEIEQTAYVCNGAPGAQGPQGPVGTNGVSTLASASAEPAGGNCAAGGVKISFGADLDGDRILDDGENTSASYICNGANGFQGDPGKNGLSTLVASAQEIAGVNCANGGVRLSFGVDVDGDYVLGQGEVNATYYVCNGAVLVPDGGAGLEEGSALGVACTKDYDCATGLSCTDGVCCDHLCTGTCEACNLPGYAGACMPIPAGQDPDSECGSVSCASFYAGWNGNTCYAKASVSAEEAACSGAGSCQSAAQLCPSQPQGPAVTTCDPTCQTIEPATCAAAISPRCTNVYPGNITCGKGVCAVTVPACANGKPSSCQPNTGLAKPELGNGLDDDCNGTIDDGCVRDTNEPNDDCAAAAQHDVGSNQQVAISNLSVYPLGDVDIFKIVARETDSTCACCDLFCTDEDYRLTISLTVPSGSGTYLLCAALSECSLANTQCEPAYPGTTTTRTFGLDGSCVADDTYTVYVRVSAASTAGVACAPYTLSYKLDSGICL